jgi:hypothetical protein
MAEKKISELTAKGAAVAATDLMVVSEVSGASYVTKSVTGANITALVTDANLTTTDITTNDVSTAKHGFAPKAPNDTAKFLRGDGTWAVPAGGGLTEFTEAANSSAPNATVPVNSLTSTGAAANIDVAIVAKGTGALMADIPDNTTTGGDKRGQYAVDWQHGPKANQNRVASSDYSTIIGGRDNRAYNTYAIAGGYQAFAGGNQSTAFQQGSSTNLNCFAHGQRATASGSAAVSFGGYSFSDTTASGGNSVAIGAGNTASAQFACAVGGIQNVASGFVSYANGYQANTFSVTGRQSRGYRNTISGDCQKSEFFLSIRTTGDTATTVTVGGGAAAATNQVILSNQSAYRFKGSIVGKQSGSTNAAVWDIDGFLVRGANAAATTLNVSNVTLVENTPAWGTPTLAADTTNGGLQVQVIGAAATNIQWTAVIDTTEVIYA